jgi:hypothetical protein
METEGMIYLIGGIILLIRYKQFAEFHAYLPHFIKKNNLKMTL